MPETNAAHLPAIDRLKGIAILWVLCIHAKVGEGSSFYEHLVNRAVPIFLVLFGVTSELWWRRREGEVKERVSREWWVGRLRRLVVPWWAVAAVFWLCFVVMEAPPVELGWKDVLPTFVGFAPWIGTTWFVALVLQFIVLFPAIRWVTVRLPEWALLAGSAAIGAFSVWHMWDVIEWGKRAFGGHAPEPGFYYAWIFPPTYFWHVVAGIVLARHTAGIPGKALTQVSIVLACISVPVFVAAGGSPDAFVVGPLRRQIVLNLFDVPLTIALLGALVVAPLPSFLARSLEWCGRASWTLYLGHVLVHEVLHLWDIAPEVGPTLGRAIYALTLLGSAVGIAFASSRIARAVRAAWFSPVRETETHRSSSA